MFGKMINRFYYGKSGKGDFTKEDLPQTRWQLFWEMLRVRFSALVRLNLMYVVVWLPTIFVLLNSALVWYSGLVELSTLEMQVASGEAAAAALEEAYAAFQGMTPTLIMQTLVLLIPCIAITGPFTAGVAYVVRNWARDEHAFIWSDFRDAVKQNWKQGLLTSAITSVMPVVFYVCFQFYGQMTSQSMLYLVPQVLCVIVVCVWMCGLMYMYPQMVTYKLNFRGLVRNSFIMAVGRLPMTVGLKLLSLVPLLLAALVAFFTPYMQYAMMALVLYYLLIGLTLSRFIGASYANAVFDRYINPNIEGATVNQGLYVETDDDDDETPPQDE